MSLDDRYPNLVCLSGKIRALHHLYTRIRDVNTTRVDFVHYAKRLMTIISEEGLAVNATIPNDIVTPTGSLFHGTRLDDKEIVAVSIIRAGDSMMESFLSIAPAAQVGKILIQRDEATAEPVFYYSKCPELLGKRVYILDPMLATGGSAIAAIKHLLDKGALEENITFLNVVACPEGLQKIFDEFPKLTVVTGVVDDGLNDKKYIVPGLGDFGDRFFGTI